MKLNLVVTEGVNKGKSIPVTKSQFLVGRDQQCHLRPASQAVSKRHCALAIRDGKVFVRDLKSTNGTFVNDKQIEGEVELHNNDRLTIGPLNFTVRIEGAPTASVPVDVPTPPPMPPKAKGKPKNVLDEDSVADMLLQLDEEAEAAAEGVIDDNIPGGTTMFEMPALTTKEDELTRGPEKPAPGKFEAAKAEKANTSSAAKEILEKYARRTR
jgi:pSer/pThr/pTyr-binding forkhead associated (FHA) protein